MIICSCKGVTQADIQKSIKNGAKTIEDIQLLTHAGTGCGRCKSVVNNILARELKKMDNNDIQLRLF